MSVVYSSTAIDYRLTGVVFAIDAGGSNGSLKLLSGASVISTLTLSFPCGTVSGGVLTFTLPIIDPSAAGTGNINAGEICDSNGDVVISGLTAGIPLSGANIIINNGLNSTLITAGNAVQDISATIIGS